jgi:hypothetical protein
MYQKIALTIIVLVFGYFISISFLSKIESRYYPVITDLNITSAEMLSAGWTQIHGTFVKVRDCPLVGINMFYDAGSSIMIPIQYLWLDAPSSRNVGFQEFGPWNIQIPNENINNFVVVSHHRCHAFYDTITFTTPSSVINRD